MRAEILVMFVMGLFYNDKKMPFSDITIITTRNIDITTQLSKYVIDIKVMNQGNDISYFIHPISKEEINHLSYIAAFDGGKELQISQLEDSFGSHAGYDYYKIEFASALKKGTTMEFRIEYVLSEYLTVNPMEIDAHQSQFVLWDGSLNYVSVYPIESDKTTVNVGNGKVLSYTGTKLGDKILYGPTSNIAPFTYDKVSIHYENNSPFITITNLERTIKISHWGNIMVKDYVEIVHKGADVKGSIFGNESTTQSSMPAVVRVLKARLPSQAYNIEFRDVLGDLSNSSINHFVDHVEANVHLRFLLLHGMITHYTLQYSIPSHEFLTSFESNYFLRMPTFDTLFDGMFIEKVEINVIFPEASHNIKILNPSNISSIPNFLVANYFSLDTVGRSTAWIEMQNLVFNASDNLMITFECGVIGKWFKPVMIMFLIATLVFMFLFFAKLLLKLNKSYVSVNVK